MWMLYLSRSDIAPLLDPKEALDCAEEAYKTQYQAIRDRVESGSVPMGVYRALAPSGAEGFIDCYSGFLQSIPVTLSMVGFGYPDNPKRFGIPTSIALATLADLESGAPVAIMEAMHLASVRTGAVGAICSKYLARSESSNLGMIGTGNIARHMLNAHMQQFKIKQVKAWSRSEENRTQFANEMSTAHDMEILPVDQPKDAVADADIICCCSASTVPRVMNIDVKEGVHINAFGADGPPKQELDINLLKHSKLVVDSIQQCTSAGEIYKAISNGEIKVSDIYGEIYEIVGGKKQGRSSTKEITVMDSTGIYIQDLLLFYRIYKKAMAKGVGTWIRMY